MALRLSDPVASPAPAAAAPPAVLLDARARKLLAAGDVAAYRALFAEAAATGDPHRRHEAQCRLLEAGLSSTGSGTAALAPIFLAVADAALAVLHDAPREPVVLNLAGIAFYELGALGAADALFKAARRLDGELPHVDGNLREIKRRRQAGLDRPLPLPSAVKLALKELDGRARRAADRARPAAGQTISLCMIVKDEEAMLGDCLAAVRDHVDEIVVVDTGSTDRTVEIAQEHGARVLHHVWTGDFAAARNVSFDAATSDWLLFLDADEVLVDGDGPALRALAGHTWREAIYLVETNHTGTIDDGTAVTHNALRLFRNRPEYRFEGRIHEQIAHRLPGYLPERFEQSAVRIEHFGYLGVVRDAKAKSQRNIELLEQQRADGVDTPFLHFNLGSEYAAAGDPVRALAEFRLSWSAVQADPHRAAYGFTPSLCARLVRAMRLAGEPEAALAEGNVILETLPGFTDIVFEQGIAARESGDPERAIALLQRCLDMGDAPAAYAATVGCGTFLALAALGDLRRERLELDAARELLHRCLVEHPRFLGAVDPLAGTMLALGEEPADVAATVHAAVGQATPAVHFMLALALYEAGHVTHAETELRAVLVRQPDSAAALAALGEALLSQSRWTEAAEVAEGSEPTPATVRTAAFARLVLADDAAASARAIAAAQALGLQEAELDVLRAWQAGAPPEGGLPADAAGPMELQLDALARVGETDAFARLVASWGAIDLPVWDRHDRLAQLYLRRGFLESAADEWIACVQAGIEPVAEAFGGLAVVAYTRGMDEDARELADEAVRLDPASPRGRRVLLRLAALDQSASPAA